jgi:hypothetical protein
VELDRASKPLRRRFNVGAGKTRVEHNGFHVGVEPNGAVNVGFDALIQVVETRLVSHATQAR